MHEDRGADSRVAAGTRVLLRVSPLAWRLEQAGRERSWALASARRGSFHPRARRPPGCRRPGCTRSWTAAGLDELDAALGELRAAGWPAPEDPDGDDDAELDGRELSADRLVDEAGWLRQWAGGLTRLHTDGATRQRPTCVRAAIIPSGRWW